MSAEAPENISLALRSQTPPKQTAARPQADPVDAPQLTATSRTVRGELDASSQKNHQGLLPAFSTKQYNQLPTPQSPSDLNRFAAGVRYSPESPIPPSQGTYAASTSFAQRMAYRSVPEESTPNPDPSQHILTPASSPFVSRTSSASQRYDNPATPTNQTSRFTNNSRPTAQFPVESSMLNSPVTPRNLPSASSSHPSPPEHPAPVSTLSSPFMAKATPPGGSSRSTPSLPSFPQDVFNSTLPSSQTASTSSNGALEPMRPPGGEIDRIRQARAEEHMSLVREAESRRPDYLKRAKRSIDETDPDGADEGGPTVGIMESPIKGRRLKLFQETSEESFEESLMAGGYGRYRTADWVRQPQPISLPLGAVPPTAALLPQVEEVEEKKPPPTEKELKKQKRLEAFRTNRAGGNQRAKLYPVELEGKGRVLLDTPNEVHPPPSETDASSPNKKRNARRKKKGSELGSAADKKALVESATAMAAEDMVEKPNWPDAEFPWRLRVQEREELARAEEEERLKWIERFLDRDSDDEEPEGPPTSNDSESEKEMVVAPERWGAAAAYEGESDRPLVARMGRGKMVPLFAHPEDPRKTYRTQRSAFPSDPGDAKAALLAKRSVRALSYRQQRRLRELDDDEDDAELCICGGVDDGRELVQCDGCQTWYHLSCIGIRHISELGREEDPWYCRSCDRRSHSPSSEPGSPYFLPMREPTFVPTDEAPPPRERSVDTTFFHQPSVQESPNWLRPPRTPTRSGGSRPGESASDSYYGSSSSSSWPDVSRNPPTTPKGHNHDYPVRIHTINTPGYDSSSRRYPLYEESPFDPTSTPSRGIRFNAPFATPKSQVWPRSNFGFQTPSRNQRGATRGVGGGGGGTGGTFGGSGSLSAVLDENVSSSLRPYPYPPHDASGSNRYHPYDESPVRRRNRSVDARRTLDSPISARLLDESPVMRSHKGKERSLDYGYRPVYQS